MNHLLAIYVHIPFCARHCAYCDFNTYVEKAHSQIVTQTVEAICTDLVNSSKDIYNGKPLSAREVSTVFLGGGTPTFLPASQIREILDTIRSNYNLLPGAEISSEANPASSDSEKFAVLFHSGFNRLSIGVQSFHNGLLQDLDRFHTAEEAETALHSARKAGFENINLDLMFGLPNQTIAQWHQTLATAIHLKVPHLSLYSLTIEPGTRFERLRAGGRLRLPEEDTEMEMYESAITLLKSKGYEHYEVSAFALPGYRCRHNLTYWNNQEYLGVGPGAVSFLDGRRWKRERLPKMYVEKIGTGTDLCVEEERLERSSALGETLFVGLRMLDGVSLKELDARFHVNSAALYAAQIEKLTKAGLVELSENMLRLTHTGLLLADTVSVEFLPYPGI